MSTRLAIIGAGDLGRQLAHLAGECGTHTPVLFFDDTLSRGDLVSGIPVFGGVLEVSSAFANGEFDEAIVAIGYHHFDARQRLFNILKEAVTLASLIHLSATVDSSARSGSGVVIHPGCSIGMNVVIGDNVLIYNGTHVAHDSRVGAHSIIAPGVSVAGNAIIGSSVFLGVGTVVSDGVTISDRVRTGAGAVVVSDLTEPGIYVGCPARLLQK